MLSAESVQHGDDRHGHQAFDPDASLLLTHGDSGDMFEALFDEFAGDALASQDTRKILSMSPVPGEVDGCQAAVNFTSSWKMRAVGAPGTIDHAIFHDYQDVTAEALQCRVQFDDDHENFSNTTRNLEDGSGDGQTCSASDIIGVENYSPLRASTDTSDKLLASRASGSFETCLESSSPVLDRSTSLVSDTAMTTAADTNLFSDDLGTSGVVSYSAVLRLTNTTYLRRIHLSRKDAVGLFPEVQRNMQSVFTKETKPRALLNNFKLGTSITIQDVKGRRWPVVLECLRTAGQRHIRFNNGWAEMCSTNGLSVGKCVRLDRWEQTSSSSPQETLVTLSIMKIKYTNEDRTASSNP